MSKFTKTQLNKMSKDELKVTYLDATSSEPHGGLVREELISSILDAQKFQLWCEMVENSKKYGHVFQNLEDALPKLSKESVIDAYKIEFSSPPPKSYSKKRMIEDIIRLRDGIARSKAIRAYKSK